MSSLRASFFFGGHDSTVALANDSQVLLSLEAERVLRRKQARMTVDEAELLLEVALNEVGYRPGVDARSKIEDVLLADWMSPADGSLQIGGTRRFATRTGHHRNHIGSSVPMMSGLPSWTAVVADGGSEDGCTGVYEVSRGDMGVLKVERAADLDGTPFTGRVFASMAHLLVSDSWWDAHMQGAGKLMGLAAYGSWDESVADWIATNWRSMNVLELEDVDAVRIRLGVDDTFERSADVAHTLVEWWVAEAISHIEATCDQTRPVALAGGCGLNVVLVGRLRRSGWDVRVPPVASDCGQAVGALLAADPELHCAYPFLGLAADTTRDPEGTGLAVAKEVLRGRVVAIVDGRAEIGPRALGHRSIIASPSSVAMKTRVSETIKGREPYRPLAAMVLRERASELFGCDVEEPFMTAAYVASDVVRRESSAVVHVDGTTRLQTVTEDRLPMLYFALKELERQGQLPILVNTSLNGRGQPIAQTVSDIASLCHEGGIDTVFAGDRIVTS